MPQPLQSQPCSVLQGRDLTFRLISVVAFLPLFLLALAAQLVGLHWRDWLPGAENCESLPGGVRSAVYSFMSYLI